MPRASKVGLQTLQLVAGKLEVQPRLGPPAELTREQREEFVRLVNSLPADWFGPAHLHLIVQYCRMVVMARTVACQLESAVSEGSNSAVVDKLMGRQESVSRVIAKLMTSLRITPQSTEPQKVSQKRTRETAVPWGDSGG